MDSYGNLLSFFTQITYLRRKCFNVNFYFQIIIPLFPPRSPLQHQVVSATFTTMSSWSYSTQSSTEIRFPIKKVADASPSWLASLRNRLWYGILIFTFLNQLPHINFFLDCISGGFKIAVDVHAKLDLHESRHQLMKQIANIVDQRLTFLVNVDKVSPFG